MRQPTLFPKCCRLFATTLPRLFLAQLYQYAIGGLGVQKTHQLVISTVEGLLVQQFKTKCSKSLHLSMDIFNLKGYVVYPLAFGYELCYGYK